MSFPINKGYVASLVVSTTAPDNKAAMWAVGPDADSVSDFRFYLGGSWQSITVLFNIAHVGNVAPVDTTKIWFDTSGNPDVYRIHDVVNNQWVQLDQLFPIHVDAGAPADNRKIWQRPLGHAFELLKYNPTSSAWENLLAVPSIELLGDITINDKTYDQKILFSRQSAPITVSIDPGVQVDFSALLERNSAGRLFVKATGGVKINGIGNVTIEIEERFSSCWIRSYAADEYKIEGKIL